MDKLLMYLQYPFVQYAIITGVVISLCSALLGVPLVLRNYSFIGDGLSHVAFGAMTVASILKLTNQFFLALPATILCSILLMRRRNSMGDAKIAVVSVGSLAFGYLAMNLFSKSANLSGDVCSVLFGSTSILTLGIEDVILCCFLGIVTVVVFAAYYNKIFSISFDEDFAKTSGIKTEKYNTMFAILIAVVIVLSMNLVGSLLVSALIIFPALSAMNVANNFKAVTVVAVTVSIICAITGILISILAGTPVGSTIVAVNALIYIISLILRKGGFPR